MNNITVELSAEDRALLNRIADSLEAIKPVHFTFDSTIPKTEPEIESQKPEKVTEPTSAQPVEEKPTEPEPAPQTEQEEGAPEVTHDDIRQIVVRLAANDKKNKAIAIVKKYAKSVSDIPADKIGEVFKELRAVVLEVENGKA